MSTRIAPDLPTGPVAAQTAAELSQAKAAAQEAEARAAAAQKAAAEAKANAKAARKAATEANLKAAELRVAADPELRERKNLTPDEAKLRLLQASREVEPLKGLREHPFTTIGVAAGAGVVMGSSGGALIALSAVLRSSVKLVKPLIGAIGPIIAARFAAKDAAQDEVQATQAPPPPPSDYAAAYAETSGSAR